MGQMGLASWCHNHGNLPALPGYYPLQGADTSRLGLPAVPNWGGVPRVWNFQKRKFDGLCKHMLYSRNPEKND